jgi:hypothetical protein
MRGQVSTAGRHPGTLPAWPATLAREFEKHPIRFTAAFSLGVHALVLLLGGLPNGDYTPGDFDSIPTTLRLTISPSDGADGENESPPEAGPPLARPEPPLARASAPAEDLPTDLDPRKEAGKSDPPPPPPPAARSASGAEPAEPAAAERESLTAGTAGAPASDIITTSADSVLFAPAPEIITATPPPALAVAIPEDQQVKIARKVLRWAQGLQVQDVDTPSQLLWRQDGREYTAVLKPRPAGSSSEYDGASVEISTTEGGQQLRTSLNLRRLAFSHFTQFVDEWDSTVQLHDDEVIGRFHSNSRLTIGSVGTAPRFRGKVTTAADDFSLGTWTRFKPRSAIFQGGFQAGTRYISLPRSFIQFGSNPAMRDARIHSFDRHTRITFYSDGTYGWQPRENSAAEMRRAIGDDPLLLVGERGVELHVRGIVRGTVLVYSPERIWVEDDLTYATNPKLVADAPDYTGLVSDKYIDIAGPKYTGPGDLNIDAAIYARTSFTVQDETARNPTRATLNIYGSLTAGTLSATEPRYATRLEFDPRFERKRPPGFPMTNRYEVEQWDGRWIAP